MDIPLPHCHCYVQGDVFIYKTSETFPASHGNFLKKNLSTKKKDENFYQHPEKLH